MIIPVDTLPSEQEPPKREKQDLLQKDVREIIGKQIERCEVTSEYSSAYIKEALKKAIRVTTWRYGQENGLYCFNGVDAFEIQTHKDEDKKVHVYVKFDPNRWDARIAQAKREEKIANDTKRTSRR